MLNQNCLSNKTIEMLVLYVTLPRICNSIIKNRMGAIMRKSILVLFALLLAVSVYGRGRGFDEKDGKSFQDVVDKMPKPQPLTPAGKTQWRKQRAAVMAEAIEATKKALPEKNLQNRVIAYLKNAISGTERCYHSDDIQKYVSASDLKNYAAFIEKKPTKDKVREIYDVERKKIEDKLLANDEIQRKKDLEKELHEKYKLFKDKEIVVVKDIRNKEYKGVYRQERTTEKLIRVGSYPISRFDLTLESRARVWQNDHDDFVKKEVRRITRKNTFLADQKSEETLDGTVQFMYLEAGYLPDITEAIQNIFAVEPKYWLTRKELAEAVGRKLQMEHFEKLMKGRGYLIMDIGDGNEYVPKNVEAAFNQYVKKIAQAKVQWEKQQESMYKNNRD